MAKTEPKKSWRERHKAHFADDMKERHEALKVRYEALKSKQDDYVKDIEAKMPKTKKIQRVCLIVGITITVLGILGFLVLHSC